MSETNEIIEDMFKQHWTGEETLKSIDNMRRQLLKNLRGQMNGFWSGHSAYKIMTKGGFLMDSKSGATKTLTAVGVRFVADMHAEDGASRWCGMCGKWICENPGEHKT